MTREEQKRIKNLVVKALKRNRSKKESIETLQNAGILDSVGKLKPPYDLVFVQK